MQKNDKNITRSGKYGFTLAETLITLVIVGIVATLTLPNLIYSYKKRVIETRLAHFSSLWQQAFQMAEAENGSSFYWDAITAINNPDAYLESYNKYLNKYIKTVETYKTPKGIAFALNNGSGFHLRKDGYSPYGWRGSNYLTFCVHYESCKNIKDEVSPVMYPDGKETFSFFENGVTPGQCGGVSFAIREKAKENCESTHYACSTLIQMDGWKIKEDYPVKL